MCIRDRSCVGALWLQRRGRRGAVILTLIVATALAHLWIVGAVVPWLNPYKSARPFSERILSQLGENPLAVYGDYLPSVAYYTHRKLQVTRSAEGLEALFERSPGALCIVPRERVPSLQATLSLQVLDEDSIGHRSFALVSEASPAGPNPSSQAGESPR